MRVTPAVARRAAGMVRMFGTPEAAAHQGRVQLRALAGMGDRELSQTIAALDFVGRAEGERRERLLGQLAAMAQTSEGTQTNG